MKKIGIIILVLVFIASLSFVGCKASASTQSEVTKETSTETTEAVKETTTETTVAEKGNPIEIGAIYSLSGAGSVIGNKQKDAVTLAINQINDNGGIEINGKKHLLKLSVRDDETKPDVGTRRLRDLSVAGIKLISGGTMANISISLSEAAKQEGAFLMASNGVPSDYFKKDKRAPYSLCIIGNTESIGRSGAAYVISKYSPKNVVYFLPDYAYGHDQETGAKAIFAAHPDIKFNVVYSPVGAADLTPYIINVRDLHPDLVVIGHWGGDAITALKQTNDMKLSKDTKVVFDWIISVFATGISPESIAGMPMQAWWYHDMTGFDDQAVVDSSNKITEEWKRATGEPPDAYGLGAYMGMLEIARGIQLAQSTDPKAVYEAIMKNPNFDSPKGPATWREDGTPVYKYWSFILEGKSEDQRTDKKWDFAKLISAYNGDEFLVSLKDLGY